MTNFRFTFPVLALKTDDKNIYVFERDIGIVSNGGEGFYKDLLIIDSHGGSYQLIKAKVRGNASFLLSLRYFQPMKELDLEFEKREELNL